MYEEVCNIVAFSLLGGGGVFFHYLFCPVILFSIKELMVTFVFCTASVPGPILAAHSMPLWFQLSVSKNIR
jgi:hypothetical protein